MTISGRPIALYVSMVVLKPVLTPLMCYTLENKLQNLIKNEGVNEDLFSGGWDIMIVITSAIFKEFDLMPGFNILLVFMSYIFTRAIYSNVIF